MLFTSSDIFATGMGTVKASPSLLVCAPGVAAVRVSKFLSTSFFPRRNTYELHGLFFVHIHGAD
jgi:hypothetical protein